MNGWGSPIGPSDYTSDNPSDQLGIFHRVNALLGDAFRCGQVVLYLGLIVG
jgi:hypothetical protein